MTSADIGPDGTIDASVQGQAALTCNGAGESIAVSWSASPPGTQTIAITFESLSIPAVYWARVNIDPAQGSVEHGHYGASSGREVTNYFGVVYPMPPCPDNVTPETFRLTVWALDSELGDDVRTYVDLLELVDEHALAKGMIDGTLIGNGGR